MKYVAIYSNDTLKTFSDRVGYQNVNQILSDNGMKRTPNIGKQWQALKNKYIETTDDPTYERKVAILNRFVDNSDIYEEAATSDSDGWKVLDASNNFKNYLYVNDSIEDSIPDSYQVLGNSISVTKDVQVLVNNQLITDSVDSNVFNSIQTSPFVGLSGNAVSSTNPLQWFKIPFDKVMLYSSLSNSTMAIPAYPESISDGHVANYTQMPDLIYQYEPWQMYASSGPRQVTFSFDLHRDMWTGDHKDGKASELIRFCEANCYPRYNGASVVPATVTLYIAGEPEIHGVMTSVNKTFDGPLGQRDDFYLHFTLELTIVEVSQDALSYDSVIQKSLIG